MKVARTVLRGGASSNASPVLDNTGGRKNADLFLECHSAPSRNAPLNIDDDQLPRQQLNHFMPMIHLHKLVVLHSKLAAPLDGRTG